jgi:hypothetical protein
MQQLTDLQVSTRLLCSRQQCEAVTLAAVPVKRGRPSSFTDHALLTTMYSADGAMVMSLKEASQHFGVLDKAIRMAHARLMRRLRHELTQEATDVV